MDYRGIEMERMEVPPTPMAIKGQPSPPPPPKCSSGDAATSGCFDCSICLDIAVEPVVTLCGHLYCWPCIYKWQETTAVADSVSPCPICKAPLTPSSIIPLYAGSNSTLNTRKPHLSIDIPRRPSAQHVMASPAATRHSTALGTPDHGRVGYHDRSDPYQFGGYMSPSSPASPLSVLNSTAGVVLEGMAVAVLPWVCRNGHEVASEVSASPRLLAAVAVERDSPRLRRQAMRVSNSLHQIWVFLFCCVLLCLVLF